MTNDAFDQISATTDNELSGRISEQEFKNVRDLVYRHFGISLSDQKRALVVGRLMSAIKNRGFSSFSEYLKWVEQDKTLQGLSELVDRISTNHTAFFRESAHFDFLMKTALPEIFSDLQSRNDRDFRLWCAASSSGEEPYTLQMCLMEYLKDDYRNWSAGLLATDISDRVLSIAKRGVYPAERVKDVPLLLLKTYFKQLPSGDFEVTEAMRKEVLYRRFNLMTEKFPFIKPFHVVFCRNVMIYFDGPTREKLVQRIYDCTVPGGYLFVGHSESLGSIKSNYKYVMPALYRKEK
jgi:chemotaxis protein methyltransferase CheR